MLIMAGGVLLGTTRCNEFDLNPSTSLPTNAAITSVDDLQMALNGVYEMMSLDRGGHGSDFGLLADVKGGDAMWIGNSGQIMPLLENEQTQSLGLVGSIYFALNEPIAFANLALEGAEGLGGAEDAQIRPYYGELLAVRAFLHFEMARAYAQPPTLSGVDMNKASSGIVLIDKVFTPETEVVRSTLKQTYDFITSELERAIPMMTSAKVLGGMNAWAAKLILARAYLYLGDNGKAFTLAADVADNSPYELFTPANYVAAWRAEGSSEFIFEVRTSDNTRNSAQRNSLGYYTNPEGYAEVGVNNREEYQNNLMSAFEALSDNDIRKVSVSERADGVAKKGYYTIKYMGRAGTTLYSSNPRPARLAEAYLIAAEAAVKGGSTEANALKYYNGLRSSRYAEGTYTDATAVTMQDILDERRIELFCENHRLFDLVRNNQTVTKYDGSATYQPNDPKLLLPIPLRELDVCPQLEQNPGYN